MTLDYEQPIPKISPSDIQTAKLLPSSLFSETERTWANISSTDQQFRKKILDIAMSECFPLEEGVIGDVACSKCSAKA